MSTMTEPDDAVTVVKDCCAPGRAVFLIAAPGGEPSGALPSGTPPKGDDEG